MGFLILAGLFLLIAVAAVILYAGGWLLAVVFVAVVLAGAALGMAAVTSDN